MSDENEEYICLINKEDQYSIWFAWKNIPHGWKQVGPTGNKKEVLKYIKEVWVDMKPKCFRKQMDKEIL